MKQLFSSKKIVSFFLCIVMVCTMITPMSLFAESYTDLSQDVKNSSDSGISSVTAQSTGTQTAAGLSLEFKEGSGLYLLSPIGIDGIHNCLACGDAATCGYTTYNGRNCFKITPNGNKQAGFLVTLNTPLLASSASGMSITLMTDINPDTSSSTSSVRILKKGANSNSAIENEYENVSLAGATTNWKTVDLSMSDLTVLQDTDGYIRSFKLYIRDRNNATYYINSIAFTSAIDGYSTVTLSGNDIRYKSGAVQAVADEIVARLTGANIGATVSVTATAYTPNTSAANGSITYNVSFTTSSIGTKTFTGLTAVVPKLTNAWLDNNSGSYGSTHNNFKQYETNFDKAGIVSLTGNTVTCAEGISTFEYAIIPSNKDYKDASVEWFAPTYLKTLTTGLRSLYVNAFLDYGSKLVSGTSYNFVVRCVTANNNYILHMNVPFTYESFSSVAENALTNAFDKIDDLSLNVSDSYSASEAAQKLAATLQAKVADSRVTVNVTPLSVGASAFVFDYNLTYNGAISNGRLATYTVGSLNRNDFYAYEGNAFTVKEQVVYYDAATADKAIKLNSPLDGTTDICLTQDKVMAYLSENYYINYTNNNDVVVTKYSNGKTETDCHPLAINFAWTGTGSSYTLKISKSSDMSSAITYQTTKTSIDVYNLFPATEYFWQVIDNNSNASAVSRFTTADNQPHQIYAEGVNNLRDSGGVKTLDGAKIKTGLIYRGGALEGVTAYDLDMIVNKLGVKTDLDLRGSSTVSPLGSQINMEPISVRWYQGIFESSATMTAIGDAISVFAYEENYPILFHCSLGRDRTGTVQALLMALCNVDEKQLHREYMLSWFSSMGNLDNAGTYAMNANFCALLSYMKSYKSTSLSLQENTEAFLLDCGVTASEIASIKSILREYPTDGSELVFENHSMVNWLKDSGVSSGVSVEIVADDIGDIYAKYTSPSTQNDDPLAYLDYSRLGKTVAADDFKYITIVAKTSAPNTNARLFLCAGDIKNATASCSVGFNYINDGLWHEYILDITDLDEFKGNINKIRFDFFDGTTEANSSVFVRSIKFHTTKPVSPTVTVEKTTFNYAENVKVSYSGLFEEFRRQEKMIPFLAFYAKNTSPGKGKALQYILLEDYSGFVSFPDDIIYGTTVGNLPAGEYHIWLAYDAKNADGVPTLNNVHYANYEPVVVNIVESSSIISNGTSTATGTSIITAQQGSTVSSLKSDAASRFSASSVTITNAAGETPTDNDIITTGMTVTAGSDSFKLVIKGDVDPDGSVNVADAAAAYAHLLGTKTLTGEYIDAALVKNTNSVNILDVMAILNTI